MSRRSIRVALTAALAILLVGVGTTAGHALWATTASTTASVKVGAVGVAETGFEGLGALRLTPTDATRTATVKIDNTGSVTAKYSAATAVLSNSDSALAEATTVTAWPATSCTGTIPAGAITGTLAAAPALTGTLAAGASQTWCVRTAVPSTHSTSGTVNTQLTTTLAAGSWVARDTATMSQTFEAPRSTGGFTCVDQGWHVTIGWNVPQEMLAAYYGVYVNGVRVAAPSQGYWGHATLAGAEIPASLAPNGRVVVTVKLLEGDQPTTTVATGAVIAQTQQGSRAIVCE